MPLGGNRQQCEALLRSAPPTARSALKSLSQLCIYDIQTPYAQIRFDQTVYQREIDINKWNLR